MYQFVSKVIHWGDEHTATHCLNNNDVAREKGKKKKKNFGNADGMKKQKIEFSGVAHFSPSRTTTKNKALLFFLNTKQNSNGG